MKWDLKWLNLALLASWLIVFSCLIYFQDMAFYLPLQILIGVNFVCFLALCWQLFLGLQPIKQHSYDINNLMNERIDLMDYTPGGYYIPIQWSCF